MEARVRNLFNSEVSGIYEYTRLDEHAYGWLSHVGSFTCNKPGGISFLCNPLVATRNKAIEFGVQTVQ